MKNKLIKKVAACILNSAMIISALSLPAYSAPADVSGSGLLVHYDMSHSENLLTDISGNGHDGILHGLTSADFIRNYGDDVLALPGASAGASGPYIDLPGSIAEGLDYDAGFSVEITFIPKSQQHQFLWTLGTGKENNYLFINPIRPNGALYTGIKTESGGWEAGRDAAALSTTEYSTVAVTSRGKTVKTYVNGELAAEFTHSHNLSDIFGSADDILGYIGKSNWNDPYCDAAITDFKMFGRSLDADEVRKEYEMTLDMQKIHKKISELSLPEYTFEDLSLADSLGDGFNVSWQSSDTEVIEADGAVHPGETGKAVVLTATVTSPEGAKFDGRL